MSRRKRRSAPRRVAPLSRDEQLAWAVDARRHGEDHPQERADAYTEAAGYYALAGDHDTADEMFRAALEDGGDRSGGVHVYYADFLFGRGREADALAQIDAFRKRRPDDPDLFAALAETLETHGRHREAANWATRGLVALYGSLADIDAEDLELDLDGRLLAADRLRARRNAGVPADHIDEFIAPFVDGSGIDEG